MELNSFLFPAPQSSYSVHGSIGDILYIPKNIKDIKESNNQSLKESDIVQEEGKTYQDDNKNLEFNKTRKLSYTEN